MHKTQVLWSACSEMPSGWSVRQHSHNFFHLIYICSGNITFCSKNGCHHLSKGNLIIFPPNVYHEIPPNDHILCEMCEVKFHILDTDIQKEWDNGKVFLTNQASHFESILRYIAYHWCLNGTHVLDIVDSFLTTILFALTANNTSFRSMYTDTSNYSDLTKRIIFYVESNYTDDYSLKQLADAIGYNKNYICSAFRRDTGMSIANYYTYVRTRRILGILYYLNTSGEITINMLSQSVGYKDASHFNRVFKNMTGITPGEYIRALASSTENPPELAIYYESHLGSNILPLHQGIKYINGIKNIIKKA